MGSRTFLTKARFLHQHEEEVLAMKKDVAVCCSDRKRPWLSPWGTAMSKEVTIAFRTNQEILRGIEAIALKHDQSVSSAIQMMLTDYIKRNHGMACVEKRRYQRKSVSATAIIKTPQTISTAQGGLVLDVSLGGLCMSVPKESLPGINEESKEPEFEATFVLPEIGEPVRMLCKPNWKVPSNGNLHVGASFVDASFIQYQKLQQFLIQ
jgi:hypothetical protein